MPHNGTVNGGSSVARNRYDVLNAPQYRCSIGGEWKPRSSFSQKNHNLLENKIKIGVRVTPASTGMKCRDHSGEPRLERRCEGPCNQVKTLADFSKNSLSNNMKWCQTCIKWRVSQDDYQDTPTDGIDPAPITPKKAFSIPIGDDDADEESVACSSRSAMYSAPSFSFLRPSNSNTDSGRLLGVSSRTCGSIPPHLKRFKEESDSGVPLACADVEDRYQPDDASILPDDSASHFAGRHAQPSRQKPAATRLTAAALHQEEQSAQGERLPTYFNSWDNAGRQHMQRRTGESETGSARSFKTRELSSIVSSEDRRTQVTAPNVWRPETKGRNKNWGKVPRKPQPPPPIPEWNENDVHIDSDGSEPDLP